MWLYFQIQLFLDCNSQQRVGHISSRLTVISRKIEQCKPLFLCLHVYIIFVVACIYSCYWLEQIIRVLARTAVVVVDFILPRVDFHELY